MANTAVQKTTPMDEAFTVAPQHLRRLLGSTEVVDRFLIVALNQMRKVPNLATCSRESILDALVRMARLGLDPSIPNEVYLVPFKNEASLILGYGGLRKLVLRTPEVRDVFTQVVCEHDVYRPAVNQVTLPTHRLPAGFQPRGHAIGYYAAALLASGLWRVVTMSKAEILAHRDRYAASAKSTFWAENAADREGLTNFDKMAMKTCLRQLCSPRYLSLDADVAEALTMHEGVAHATSGSVSSFPPPVPALSPPLEPPLEAPGILQGRPADDQCYVVDPDTGELRVPAAPQRDLWGEDETAMQDHRNHVETL